MSEMKKVFNIPEDTETRVWNKFMSNSCELLTNMEHTVQNAGLYQGQVNEDETIYTLNVWSGGKQLVLFSQES